MRSADLLLAGRRRAGLSQEQLAERLGRRQSTIARWESGAQHPALESVVDALHACGLELSVGMPRYDDSYDSLIAQQLHRDPAERVRHLAPGGFDPIGVLGELARRSRFVLVGRVAGAFHGWPIALGKRTLQVVPADPAMLRIEQAARRLGAEPAEDLGDGSRRWLLPSGGELHATLVPPGTRGYSDLLRDAQSVPIAPGVSVRVASLIDLIRIAEASPDPDARTFVPALWATLDRGRRYDTETPEAERVGV
ncbi:MAG TPA: helix-turn-helix transcriptional regulator [Solirubrobacteraceae bacterium]|jgi:transcriptional regulator with XRE-family HTH domain|nr:helix-turn-helix transcriptional regulator [Solirubrobacteraceae bacterium]